MSFPGRILSSTNIFKPALSYIQSIPSTSSTSSSSNSPSKRHPVSTSVTEIDDIDSSPPSRGGAFGATLRPWHSRDSSGEHDPNSAGGIPLIHYSRTPSPSPYRADAGSEDEEGDEEGEVPLSLRQLGEGDGARGWWRRVTGTPNLGGFLFGTWTGWQCYVVLLGVWSFGAGFMLVLMNRFILWTGTYKFPYPLAHTWIQLWFTHGWLVVLALLTRLLGSPMRRLGLASCIAPSYPGSTTTQLAPRKGIHKLNPLYLLFSKTGGIAGGGFMEFDRGVAMDVAPLAVIFVGKAVLSNISYAYAQLPLYTLSRIPTVPMVLILTAAIGRTSHSIPTLSSTLVLTLNLLIASVRSSERVIWESIVAGVFSTLFSALFPILLLRTHKKLIARSTTASGTGTGDVFTDGPSSIREETRAYWTLLHYTSLLSLTFLTPLLLISGELPNILHNCYFLDVPWFWFLQFLGGLASLSVFATVLAFVRATSPLTVEVIKLPRQAAQMMILERFRLPVHAWVGVGLCYAGMGWYAWVRRDEGRRWEMRRIGRARR